MFFYKCIDFDNVLSYNAFLHVLISDSKFSYSKLRVLDCDLVGYPT